MDIEILFENKNLIGCVKPAGVISEDGGMPDLLSEKTGGRVFCVHRLDRETGGCMVYAKNGKAAALLTELIAGHRAEKEYLCVVEGAPDEKTGTYRDLLFHDKIKNKTYVVNRMRKGVKEAELDYEVLKEKELRGKKLSLVHVTIKTGRSHQIRVQFASRKMPVYGDTRYASTVKGEGLHLWSARYSFTDPFTEERIVLQKRPPREGAWAAFEEEIYSHMES